MRIIQIHFLVLFTVLSALPVFAQYPAIVREDIWVAPVGEVRLYNFGSPPIYGGGAALGYGDGLSFGLRVFYLSDIEKFTALELNFAIRLYPLNMSGHSGLFVQLHGGPVVLSQKDKNYEPTELGTFSAGVSAGWRFVFGRYFYAEPAFGFGYPYSLAAGISAGFRF